MPRTNRRFSTYSGLANHSPLPSKEISTEVCARVAQQHYYNVDLVN